MAWCHVDTDTCLLILRSITSRKARGLFALLTSAAAVRDGMPASAESVKSEAMMAARDGAALRNELYDALYDKIAAILGEHPPAWRLPQPPLCTDALLAAAESVKLAAASWNGIVEAFGKVSTCFCLVAHNTLRLVVARYPFSLQQVPTSVAELHAAVPAHVQWFTQVCRAADKGSGVMDSLCAAHGQVRLDKMLLCLYWALRHEVCRGAWP